MRNLNVYLIGSLRNPQISAIGRAIRALGYEVFDDWFAAGKIADDEWQAYETARGRTYIEALDGFAARHVFEFDLHHLNRADLVVLIEPCGRSGYLELGWALGQGKTGYVLLESQSKRWDVMLCFVNDVFTRCEDLLAYLAERMHDANDYDSNNDDRQALACFEDEGGAFVEDL